MIVPANFSNIKEFMAVKENCPFCKTKLKIMLTNFVKGPDKIPILKAKLENDFFRFKIQHTSHTLQMSANVDLDTINNSLTFYLDSEDPATLDWMIAKTVFENMKPYVELYCPSRKCKMKYYLSSSIITSSLMEGSTNYFIIKPVSLFMEAFVHNNLWVQNDWENHSINIYSINNYNSNPIKGPLLDLEAIGKEKILNKVRTLVIFS